MDNDRDDSQGGGGGPPKGTELARRSLGGINLTSISRELRLFDSRLSQMGSTAGVVGKFGNFLGYVANLHSNWSLTRLLSKIAGSEREYCVLGSEQIDDFAFLSLKTDTQRSLLRVQLACSEGENFLTDWTPALSEKSGEHEATVKASLKNLGFDVEGLLTQVRCASGWCAGSEKLLRARVRTRRQFVWGDYVGVREFKVLGYRSGPGDLLALGGELFVSLDDDPVVIDLDNMLVTWLDADTRDVGETLECHFELGSSPETEAMFLAVRVFTYCASGRGPTGLARKSSETVGDAFRSLKLCTGSSEKLLRAYISELQNLTSGQEAPTVEVLRRRAGLGGETGPLRRTTMKNVLDGLEGKFIIDAVPSGPILSFQFLSPDAGMRAAEAAAEEIANSYGVEPSRVPDPDFSPVVACILGEKKARRLPDSATKLGRRAGKPVLTKCSLGLAVSLPAVETVYIAPRLGVTVSPSHLVPYTHSTGEVVARLPQILNILRLDQNEDYMRWLVERVKEDATCVTTLGGAGGYDVLMHHLDGSEFSMRTLYDEALETAKGVDGRRLGTLCITALRANGAVYGSGGTGSTSWLDAVNMLCQSEKRDGVTLLVDTAVDLAGQETNLEKGGFLSINLQSGGWEGKFLKIEVPGGVRKWAGWDGPDGRKSTLQGEEKDLLRGGQGKLPVTVGEEKRDPQIVLTFDKLLVGHS